MSRHFDTKQVLIACQMSFNGKSNREIADFLDRTEATVSNWRKLEIWQEFEAELIKAYKERILRFEDDPNLPTLANVTPS